MPTASSRPNVIYILSDQHRHAAMSHTGDPNVRTPAMDHLAEQGVSFGRAYANCPVCVPSRGTLFTGRHAHANGVLSNYSTLYPIMPTSAKELIAAGYHTCYIGKWHLDDHGACDDNTYLHPDGKPLNNCHYVPPRYRGGFQDWYEGCAHDHFRSFYFQGNERTPRIIEGYETDGYTDLALNYLKTYTRQEPLFLVLSVCPPHGPFQAPERNRRLDHRELKVRPNFSDVVAGEKAEYARVLGHITKSYREYLAMYYAMVENLDENIARLLAFLDSDPRYANTLVVYLSDHGEYGGSHGRMYAKHHPHEEGVRIPMIWRWPGRISPAAAERQPIVSMLDVMPTTLGLAGVPVPAYCQGRDFSGYLLKQEQADQDFALLEMGTIPRFSEDFVDWRGLVTREWKYALYEDGSELLFNLTEDPFEQCNRADRPADAKVIQSLRERLSGECERTGDAVFPLLLAQRRQPNNLSR